MRKFIEKNGRSLMIDVTKEYLLDAQSIFKFVKTSKYETITFDIRRFNDRVVLEMVNITHCSWYFKKPDIKMVTVVIRGNEEEYINSEYEWNDRIVVFEFLHELKLDYYGVTNIFNEGVKIGNKNYLSTIVPFEFREPKKMKLYKNVSSEDLDKILKEGILPISKTGNDNWEGNRRANNSTEVVYLFNPISDVTSFTQYGDVVLEVEVEAYRNEIAPNDSNRGQYEEYIVAEVKPEEIVGVRYE
ncbi:hypothetical protein O3802_05240 [Gemella sp. 27098_8_92]|uniref:hypothetical protein n=1 Tax=Gemella sp. 27098_8_92 TaxID=3003687 RepID=UPI00352DFC79